MKRKIIYIFIIVILWIAIFSFFLFAFQNKEERKVLDVNSFLVQDLYNKAVPNKNFYILEQLYKNEILTNEYKLNIGIMNLI